MNRDNFTVDAIAYFTDAVSVPIITINDDRDQGMGHRRVGYHFSDFFSSLRVRNT